VADSGWGSKEKLQLIFDPFSQARLIDDEKIGGTGLGYDYFEQAGGNDGRKIWVEATGRGTIPLQRTRRDRTER